MVRVTTNRGTSTRNVKKAKRNWAGSNYKKLQNKQLAGKTLSKIGRASCRERV